MKKGVIYKVICGNNFLFGSTFCPSKRFHTYRKQLSENRYGNNYLQNSYNKYGEESLKFEIVQENIPEDILKIIEDIWMGANCSKIQDKKGGMNIKDAHRPYHSEETKEKIRKANTGNRVKEKHHFYGKKRPDMSLKMKGFNAWERMSEENKLKRKKELSKMFKGKKLSENQKIYRQSIRKPVIQYDLEGNFIKEWDSTLKTREGGFQHPHVKDCCKGVRKTHKKFIWKYKNME